MASNLVAIASNLLEMTSDLVAMASNLLEMTSKPNRKGLHSSSNGLQPTRDDLQTYKKWPPT